MRNSTRRTALVLAGAVAASFAALAPASAATETTFTIGGGNLSVSQAAPKHLGTVGAGELVLTGQLGDVKVTDERRVTGTWTASAQSTDFTSGTGPYDANNTVPASSVVYTVLVAKATTGTVVPTVGAGTFGTNADGTPKLVSAMTAAVTGNNTVTWDPTLTIQLESNDLVGTYTGTITHSVA